MAAAIQLYRQQPEELKVVLKRLVDADSISNEVKPEGFRGLLDLMGPELFQTWYIYASVNRFCSGDQ